MEKLLSLKNKLDAQNQWPLNYMFKFIVPADLEKVARIEALFDSSAVIYHKESRTGKFISITAKQEMNNSSAVIAVYEKASSIDDIVAL